MPRQVGQQTLDLLQLGALFGQPGIALGIGDHVGLAQQLLDLAISSRKRLELVGGKHG